MGQNGAIISILDSVVILFKKMLKNDNPPNNWNDLLSWTLDIGQKDMIMGSWALRAVCVFNRGFAMMHGYLLSSSVLLPVTARNQRI